MTTKKLNLAKIKIFFIGKKSIILKASGFLIVTFFTLFIGDIYGFVKGKFTKNVLINVYTCSELKGVKSFLYNKNTGEESNTFISGSNQVYIAIENRSKNTIENVDLIIQAKVLSEYGIPELLYQINGGSSMGVAKSIFQGETSAVPHVRTSMTMNTLNPGEFYMGNFIFDRPIKLQIEARGEGFTFQESYSPNCNDYKKIFKKLDLSYLAHYDCYEYVDSRCSKKEELFGCNISNKHQFKGKYSEGDDIIIKYKNFYTLPKFYENFNELHIIERYIILFDHYIKFVVFYYFILTILIFNIENKYKNYLMNRKLKKHIYWTFVVIIYLILLISLLFWYSRYKIINK